MERQPSNLSLVTELRLSSCTYLREMRHQCRYCSLQFETEMLLQKHVSSFHQKQDASPAQPLISVSFEKIKCEPELINLDEDEDKGKTGNSRIPKQQPEIRLLKSTAPQIVNRSQQKNRYQCEVCSEQFHLLRYFKKHLVVSGEQTQNKCQEHYGISNNNNFSPAPNKPCTLKRALTKTDAKTSTEKEVQTKCKESEHGTQSFTIEVEISKNQVEIPVPKTVEACPAPDKTSCKQCHLNCASLKHLCVHYAKDHKLPVVALSHLDKHDSNQKYIKTMQTNRKKIYFKCDTCQHLFFSQYNLQKHACSGSCNVHLLADGHHKSTRTDVRRNEVHRSKFVEHKCQLSASGECCANLQVCKQNCSSRTILNRGAPAIRKGKCFQKSAKNIPTLKAQTLNSHVNRTDFHICNICNQEFSKRLHLKRHKVATHQVNPKECDICQRTFTDIRNLKNHILSIHKEVRHTCNLCQKTYTNKHYLKIHKLNFHKGLSYTCDVCQKPFAHKGSLQAHKLSVHDGVRYTCDLCQTTFAHKQHLMIHKLKIHEGMRYTCDICQKTFTCKKYLKIHKLNIHDGVRYTCDLCQKTFAHRGSLRVHKLNIHDGLCYTCDICQKTFTRKENFKLHKIKAHDGLC